MAGQRRRANLGQLLVYKSDEFWRGHVRVQFDHAPEVVEVTDCSGATRQRCANFLGAHFVPIEGPAVRIHIWLGQLAAEELAERGLARWTDHTAQRHLNVDALISSFKSEL